MNCGPTCYDVHKIIYFRKKIVLVYSSCVLIHIQLKSTDKFNFLRIFKCFHIILLGDSVSFFWDVTLHQILFQTVNSEFRTNLFAYHIHDS